MKKLQDGLDRLLGGVEARLCKAGEASVLVF